jgi:acyl-CoA synthetase (AMP-forming)/AMP-acid ligase II
MYRIGMIFRSPFPNIDIPNTPLTSFVLQNADRLGSKPALIDAATGRTFTYGELSTAIRRIGAAFRARGIRKNDTVAIFSPNCPEYALAFHGACSIGAAVTTVNPLYTSHELRQQLIDARAKIVITGAPLLPVAVEASSEAGVRDVLTFDDLFCRNQRTGPAKEAEIDPANQIAALPYSSGTTGYPKGVMLTHRNLVANLLQVDASRQILENDVLLCVLPLYHIYGLVVILNHGLQAGATIVTMPRFDLEEFLSNLQKFRVTFAHVVPPILVALCKTPLVEKYNVSGLRRIFTAAAPASPRLLTDCSNRLGCLIKQGYGMTEASPATHMSPDEPERDKLGSVGVCVSNTECKVVDVLTGSELNANQEGEICIRGPQIMKGYLNRPEATAASIDSDGWLHSGDIGYADRDGYFFIVDRLKELIKYKGFQVAPAELEAVLLSHPHVADAAVIPVPDSDAGEIPKAFVVLRGKAGPEEILQYVAERVAPYKKIREIEFLDQIPKSPSGKILRRLLKQRNRAADEHR